MKKSWWKVPLYCMLASWVCFQLEVHFLGRWTLVTLPDGSVTTDSARWMVMCAVLFLAVVCVGGFLFFRRMTRRELLCSASVLAGLNVVLGLLSYITNYPFPLLWSMLTEWDSIFSYLLYNLLGLNQWLSAALIWLLPPYIFVLFGKGRVTAGDTGSRSVLVPPGAESP